MPNECEEHLLERRSTIEHLKEQDKSLGRIEACLMGELKPEGKKGLMQRVSTLELIVYAIGGTIGTALVAGLVGLLLG